jgi:hypothetical protein
MARGFSRAEDFRSVVGWELYQVTLDKYHVMFLFENGWQLLNIAHSFSYYSADGSAAYTFEIYGSGKIINIDRILRARIVDVMVPSRDRLVLTFENGDDLIVHDDPSMRSWWFMPIDDPSNPERSNGWSLSDDEID